MINKKIKKIIVILILFVLIFPYQIIFAATSAEVGNAIATFAKNYVDKKGSGSCLRILHSFDGSGNCYAHRALNPSTGFPAYTTTFNGETVYEADCVGFVNICIAAVTKNIPDNLQKNNSSASYVAGGHIHVPSMFESAGTGNIQPGDIGSNGSHTWIYVGNNAVVHAFSYKSSRKEGVKGNSPIYQTGYSGNPTVVARIKESEASKIDANNLITDPTIGSNVAPSVSMSFEQSEFYYNGAPDGKYSVTKGTLEWLIDSLKQIMAFLINIIFYIIRMVFVGWTALIDNLITWIMETITNDDAVLKVDSTKSDDHYENLTVEDIVFNNVKAFDVDFFDLEDSVAETTP